MRKCANDQLSLVRLLDLKDGDRVSRSRIEAAAALWTQPRGRRCDRAASSKTRDRLVSHGVRWLTFLGWLEDDGDCRHPHHGEVPAFARWSREDRGLSDATVQSYCKAADHFFGQLAAKGVRLSAVGMADIDDAMAAEHERGALSRRTRHDYAQRLRAFFLIALRHAAAQHLLDQGTSMKVIGDFLGHRDPSSTTIYAKVDLAALREVAALDLEGLA